MTKYLSGGAVEKQIIDTKVYMENQHFRLLYSSKASSGVKSGWDENPPQFRVADGNEFEPRFETSDMTEERAFLLESFVLNTAGGFSIIMSCEDFPFVKETRRKSATVGAKQSTAARDGTDHVPEGEILHIPKLVNLICEDIGRDARKDGDNDDDDVDDDDNDDYDADTDNDVAGPRPRVTKICHVYYPAHREEPKGFLIRTEFLTVHVSNYRFCERIGQNHDEDDVYLIVDVKREVWYQKCRRCPKTFRSEERQIPAEVMVEILMTFCGRRIEDVSS